MLVAIIGVAVPFVARRRRRRGARLRHEDGDLPRRRADRDERRHHGAGVRRPRRAGDHRGADRARRRRRRRRARPDHPHRRRQGRHGRGRRSSGACSRRSLVVAVGFLVVTGVLGILVVPPLFGCVDPLLAVAGDASSPSRFVFILGLRRARRLGQAGVHHRRVHGRAGDRPQRPARAHRRRPQQRRRTCSSRSSSSRSASTPTSRRCSSRAVLGLAARAAGHRRSSASSCRRCGAVGTRGRQAADRHRDDPARRGRPDLRQHRAGQRACSTTTCTAPCSSSC